MISSPPLASSMTCFWTLPETPILQQMFGRIEARIHALRRVSLRVGGRSDASRQELLKIIDLIERRDGPAAAEAAQAHVVAVKAAALAAVAGHR